MRPATAIQPWAGDRSPTDPPHADPADPAAPPPWSTRQRRSRWLRQLPLVPLPLVGQFARFGCVGLVGLAIDTGAVYALRQPCGLIGAGLLSYGFAATATWALNRCWTFRYPGNGRAYRQWLRFLAANLVGLLLNRGAYMSLVLTLPLAAAQPAIATAAGSLAGMFVNFWLARRVVFR